MGSVRGHLLIASPQLADPNFVRSVVLIIEHHEQGALGVILNRPSSMDLNSFCREFMGATTIGSSDKFLDVGGPCDGEIFCVHTDASRAESEILGGVYLATHADAICEIIQENKTPFRVFLGYAGWGAGQLDAELQDGGWLSNEATIDQVFGWDQDSLWHQVIKWKGEEVLKNILNIHCLPEAAEWN